MDDKDVGQARWASAVGLLGLASGMGIGRFAFTPMLPLMQAEGLSLAAGSQLAAANYLGYLAGALACTALNPRAGAAARAGLLGVAVCTLAMAASPGLGIAWLWRFAAGVCSAFVLVGVSAWAMGWLARAGRPAAGGVFAGVGVGMAAAGGIAWLAGLRAWPAAPTWAGLGLLALAVALLTWRPLRHDAGASVQAAAAPAHGVPRAVWPLVACYGALGFGYILPATFLPALARLWVDDARVFGAVWPVFGVAAALSTLVAAPLLVRHGARGVWAAAMGVMAVGVLLPVVSTQPLALVLSAVGVGGTFMVATMAGLQEARRLGSAAPTRVMAAMTAAFATGQWLGPLTVSALARADDPITRPSLLAAAVLLMAMVALRWRRRPDVELPRKDLA